MYAAKFTNKTVPYKMLVFPLLKDSMTINTDKVRRIISFLSRPNTKGISYIILTAEIAGILNPILANADPKAKFKLD